MATLLLPRRFGEDSNALWRAASEAGMRTERLMSYESPAHLRGASDLVFYGETLLADALIGSLGLGLIEPDESWLPRLSHAHRLRDVGLDTFGAACAQRAPRFIKPTDEKLFPARVYADGRALAVHDAVAPDAPVLVAEPVRFGIEFRAFVLDRQVAALSPYIRDGEMARRDGAWFAEPEEWQGARACLARLLDDARVELPPALVIDVGLIEGRGWAVVEANPAWGSGLCGCDPRDVLPVLVRCSISAGAEDTEERRWLRKPGLTRER